MNISEKTVELIKKEYGVLPERPWQKDPQSMTFKCPENGKWFALIMPVNLRSLGLEGDGEMWVVNLKTTEDFGMIAMGMKGIMPAYHMNKRHWITVFLDGSVQISMIKQLIDISYRLVSDSPTKRIYEVVKQIPKGKVATYGLVAELAGNSKMSRAVGNALHKNPDPDNIPCYRVVNSKGELAGEFAFGGPGEQAKLLMADGIEVVDGRVDLDMYLMERNTV